MNEFKPAPAQGVASPSLRPMQPAPTQASPGMRPVASPSARSHAVFIPPPKPNSHDESSLELVDEAGAEVRKSKIHAFSSANVTHAEHQWKRQPLHSTTGAIRVRTFHCRISDQGLEYMDNAINDWLDANPDIELKNVTSTVGLFDGKIKEPALILNLWY